MAEEEPPVLPLSGVNKERYDAIISKFTQTFGAEPQFFARAPGRVNLIGEHIDYCGYPVLPMAIEQDVVMAVLPDPKGKVMLVNTDSQYETFETDVMNFEITKDIPSWYKYALCGIQGIKEQFCSIVTMGFMAVVDGIVPRSAGLSSSSALVCCSALAVLKANNWPMSKVRLSEVCAKCEHYIGTEGGGMDQAISFTAQAGKAKLIEFNPLKTTDVTLPPEAAFVVSNSMAEMNKAATPHFNVRVVECRLATQLVAKSKGLNWRQFKQLGALQVKLGVSLEEMLNIAKSTLHSEAYTKDELCKILDVSPEELTETSLSANTLNHELFYLQQRASHVYSEAQRVLAFKAVCDDQPSNALTQLGKLMDESHASCRDLYECSHPDLDKLVDICKEQGAVGSRMTGAGWGGCAVSLVRVSDVQAMVSGVQEGYYKPDPKKLAKVKESLFATVPGAGAAFYEMC